MEIGCRVESRRPWTSTETIRTVATRAEALGYDSLWVSDHVVLPSVLDSTYPYGPTALFTPAESQNYFEAITVLSFLAGVTQRPKLGVSVLVVPQRQPLVAAKQWATLDTLSGGRTILGVGAGWLREEFTALGVDTFERRGKALDEAIRIYRGVFTERGDLSFEGEVYRFGPIRVGPNAAQPGGVPIWIGGHSRRAQRRAAELGDGWQATRVTRAELAAGRDNIQALLPRYGREPGAVLLAVAMSVWAPGTGPSGEVHESDLVGSAAEMAERVRAYRAEGVEHLLLQLQPSDSYAASLDAVEFFGREVRPLLGN